METIVTVELTLPELEAVIGWAGMAAVGFSFGPKELNPEDPSQSALAKFQEVQEEVK